ncbi:uncharacterized protein EHS24_000979 [Apiotrichum porosum]|uniref:Uncharacterized protein n=1 Tax=Apiotrichum porosum TaxID=105984 RepID=A0A427YBP5_9TREE|nr:uncharacterized protein EHS24_000979 [Apiotrichum porosum]RSH88434.1 hypothetical protein EHS24_000979 [Apiotrichum porosum]
MPSNNKNEQKTPGRKGKGPAGPSKQSFSANDTVTVADKDRAAQIEEMKQNIQSRKYAIKELKWDNAKDAAKIAKLEQLEI